MLFFAIFTGRQLLNGFMKSQIERNFNWEGWYNGQIRVVCHMVFWLLVTGLYYLIYSRVGGNYIGVFVVKDLLVTSSLFYSASWIISRWVSKGKVYPLILFIIFAFIWWLMWTYLTCYAAKRFISETDQRFNLYLGFFLNDGFWGLFKLKKLSTLSLDFITLVSVPLAPKLTKVLLESSMKMVKLERDNLAMELDFLRSQVSPHFLFNILNSIYRMSEKNDPQTPNTVLQLSNMMRYVLYQAKNDEIALYKEVAFIKDYIDLAKLRYGDKVPIVSNIVDIDEPYKVVSLMLIPFIENALKHGPDRSRDGASVDISLQVTNDILFLSVKNSVNHKAEEPPVGGVGLRNVRRRLELHYPKRHSLDITEGDSSYAVKLMINLK